jgi:SAM-dependent methyltransferase
MFTNTNLTNIESIFDSIKENEEFEVMFNNYKVDNKLSIIKFMNILKYIKYRSDTDNLVLKHEVLLDISFDYEPNKAYRVSINNAENINEFLNLVHQRSNHIIFSILLSQSEFTDNPNFTYIKKTKDPKMIYDMNSFDIRIRKAGEEPLTEKDMKSIINLGLNNNSKISFRYKNRLNLIIIDNENEKLSIDTTTVQTNTNVNELYSSQKNYELEIEYFMKTPIKHQNPKILKILLKEITNIKNVLEGTSNIMTKEEQTIILEAYKKLVYQGEASNNLYSMQPISVEVQHIVDKIPNRYSVTDKADGEKYQLFIFQKEIYLISNNFNVLKTNYKSDYNNTILEGEYLFFHETKKYLVMIYDCLYFNGIDIRKEIILKNRLNKVIEFCKSMNKIYEIKMYENNFNLKKQELFYENEVKEFFSQLNKNLESSKPNSIIFYPKIFLYPNGGSNSEVFSFSYLLWTFCTNLKNNCPYTLDGIIYTGLEQKYTRDKREQKYPEYKYKPPSTNSLDVYIVFQKNSETGSYLEVFDNTNGFTKLNQIYRVANIYVGDNVGNKEVPVLFLKEENNHEIFLPLVNDEVRDVDNNYVQDSTVVELIYNNDINIPHQYRWIILRTRWDKTEFVITQKKKYGNFKDSAIKTWKSMKEAVTIEEIQKLGNADTYNKQQKLLETRLNSTVITTEKQQDIYYQIISNLGKIMRGYHNWIKSIIIYSYCKPIQEYKNKEEKRSSVLDLGCGVGGDLMKWYHAKVGDYVGIDTDYHGIYSSVNGAVSKYNELKKKFPDFGKITWIQADGSALLNVNAQEAKIPNMTEKNKELIEKTFKNKKFDIISAQFAIHYLFDTPESISNLISNVNNLLKIGGYIILTLFDAKQIIEKLTNKDAITSYYTDDNGNRKIFYEIKKKYEDKNANKNEVGLAIDVHMAWIMEENKYITEYLVTEKLLTETLKQAGCRLIETDLFSNLYYLNQEYFTNVIEHEENKKNYKFYKDVARYYGDLKTVDKDSKTWTFLNRYYVYQKFT